MRYKIEPFIKWRGGKRLILKEIHKRKPAKSFTKYYEPFLGGGAVVMSLQPTTDCYLSDISFSLINCYKIVRDHPLELLKHLENHKKKACQNYFNDLKKSIDLNKDGVKTASEFIYLSRTCFNGALIFSGVNISPRLICDTRTKYFNIFNDSVVDNILTLSEFLKDKEIKCQSYEKTRITKNSFYYFDPPYFSTHQDYNANKFNLSDQENLKKMCDEIHNQNSLFMLSNSDEEKMKELYKDYNIRIIKRLNNWKGPKYRTEILVTNY